MSPNDDCQLCEGAAITTRYFDDEECWVADCVICRVPMVVWRVHDPLPSAQVRERLVGRLAIVARDFYDLRPWRLDDEMRRIPDHFHAHARPLSAGGSRVKR